MASHTIPIYRHGRKFYVSAEEYERIRAEERQLRRAAILKSQQLPTPKVQQISLRSPSVNAYNPIQNVASSPQDSKSSAMKTRYVPVNLSKIPYDQNEKNRISRSTLKHYEDRDDLLAIPPTMPRRKTSADIRSQQSEKSLDNRRTPSVSKMDNKTKPLSSAEIAQGQVSVQQEKTKQQVQVPSRRSIPVIVSEYGMSSTANFSMTPSDHTLLQINSSRPTTYLTRMKQSNLNSPSKSVSLSSSATNSLVETSMQGFDQVYTVLATPSRRAGTISSSATNSSIIDPNKHEYYHHDTTSTSFSDDNSSSPSLGLQKRNIYQNNNQRLDYTDEREDIQTQQRDSWTRSTIRSQSSDGITEKKRVRFADTEGFKLEIVSDKSQLKSPKKNRLLTRRQTTKVSSDLQDRKKPAYDTFYQVATKVGESKLATDV